MPECKCGCGNFTANTYVHGHNAKRPLAERFWSRVDKRGPDECWTWLGTMQGDGLYGKITENRKPIAAHRASYILAHGSLSDDLHIDHLCSNPSCVNPAHLEAVTQAENNRRQGERKTHCKRGHDYSQPGVFGRHTNTLKDGTKVPSRQCLQCQRLRRAAKASA